MNDSMFVVFEKKIDNLDVLSANNFGNLFLLSKIGNWEKTSTLTFNDSAKFAVGKF